MKPFVVLVYNTKGHLLRQLLLSLREWPFTQRLPNITIRQKSLILILVANYSHLAVCDVVLLLALFSLQARLAIE